MTGEPKRLDMCLGDFAVSLQGFDDPMAVLKEVVELGRKAVTEAPEMLNTRASFTTEAISEIMDRAAVREGLDRDALTAMPGILIVNRGDVAEAQSGARMRRRVAGGAEAATAAEGAGGDTIRSRLGFDDEDEKADLPAPASIFADVGAEEGDTTVVNIFGEGASDAAASTAGAATGAATGTDDEGAAAGHRPLFARRDGGSAKASSAAPFEREQKGIGLGPDFESLLSRVHGSSPTYGGAEDADGSVGGAKDAKKEAADDRMSPADAAAALGTATALDALRAAAAFLSVIRRQPRFTRREIQKVFDEMPGDFPRTLEIQVKGVGKLVRTGDLRRMDDDTYALNPEILETAREQLTG